MATRNVKMMVCDNPECKTEDNAQVYDKENPPLGYTLSGHYDLRYGGGSISKVFACRLDCLVPAIKATIERER